MTSLVILFLCLFLSQLSFCYAEEQKSELVLCFLFFLLFVGSLFTYFLSRYVPIIPYTVFIFFFGIIFAAIFNNVSDYDTMNISLKMWENINPELILFVFLPALLFGESMTLNFNLVSETFSSASLLAGPMALIGAFGFGAIIKFVTPYDWPWKLCFLFGSITCATDPVAVVALLKKCGAPKFLTYLIIGEALLNDATALVLYKLLYKTIQKGVSNYLTVKEVVIYFIKVIFVSPLIGIAIGLASVLFLHLANRRMKSEDHIIQMAITFCTAYISFFVAEYMLEVSGVISCCAAGLMISRFGASLILEPESIHIVWGTIEWVGNTLIFAIAGIIIGAKTFQYIIGIDLVYIVISFLILVIVRFILVFVSYPYIRSCNNEVNVNQAIFASWGGLRGAVCVTLAVSLVRSTENNETEISGSSSHQLFFLIGGMAALTLLINATTCERLMIYLQVSPQSLYIDESPMKSYVSKRMRWKAIESLKLVYMKFPQYINFDQIVGLCPLLQSIAKSGEKDIYRLREEIINDSQAPNALDTSMELYTHQDISYNTDDFFNIQLNKPLAIEIRRTFLDALEINYAKQLQTGRIPRAGFTSLVLLNSIDYATNFVEETGILDIDYIYDKHGYLFEPISRIDPQHESYNSWTDYIYKQFEQCRKHHLILILLAMIEAHEYASRKIPFYLGNSKGIDTPEEALIIRESQENLDRLKSLLNEVDIMDIRKYYSNTVASWILHLEEELIQEYEHEGILLQKDAEILYHEIQMNIESLDQYQWKNVLMLTILLVIYSGRKMMTKLSEQCLEFFTCSSKPRPRRSVYIRSEESKLNVYEQ